MNDQPPTWLRGRVYESTEGLTAGEYVLFRIARGGAWFWVLPLAGKERVSRVLAGQIALTIVPRTDGHYEHAPDAVSEGAEQIRHRLIEQDDP